jgi:uncharacterized protein (DUF1697 family)
LSAIPETNRINKLYEIDFAEDQFRCIDNLFFLHCHNNYGNTKLSNNFIEKKLNINATTRNWRTTQELIRIAEALSN